MTKKERDEKALALCSRIEKIDTALGRFADYEGEQNGPTWHAWTKGYVVRQAAEAMRLHSQAMMVWGKLRALAPKKSSVKFRNTRSVPK